MAIPSRLIQVQIDFSGRGATVPLRPVAKAAVTNLKLLHPDWDYVFFDDAAVRRFVAEEFPQYESTFNSFRYPIQQVDFFRYLAVYRLGGFYFDFDVLLFEKLDDLLSDECVFSFEELFSNSYLLGNYGMDWMIGNYAFGAAPGAVFLEKVIQNCVRAQRDRDWANKMMKSVNPMLRWDYRIINSTGPGLVSRTFAEEASPDVTILFPQDVREKTGWHQFGNYGVHLMNGGWRGGSALWMKLAWRWDGWQRKTAMRRSIKMGPTRIRSEMAPA